jgi:hypothetical protein
MTEHATGHMTTTAADRYAKQLASHLGRRSEIREDAEGTVIVLTNGECRLVSRSETLELYASAPTGDDLAGVKDVVGRHLERFGQRNELTVEWD